MVRALQFAFALMLFCGCSATVDLTVKNNMGSTRSAKIEISDEDGVKQREIPLGDISSKGQTSTEFKIPKHGSFVVDADVSQAMVYQSSPVTVTGKQDPLSTTIEIEDQCRKLDDSRSLATLSQSFKNLGPDIGGSPLAVQNALEAKVGAIVVAVEGDSGKIGRIIMTAATAGQLGVKVMKLEDVPTFPNNESNSVDISGKSSSEISSQFGPLAAFGVSFDVSSVYRLSWQMKGFGQVDKPEDSDKSPFVLFSHLDTTIILAIKNALEQNPGSRVYYISHFYLLQNAELSVERATAVSSSAKVNTADIVSGNAVLTFENQTTSTNSYGPVVLNYWGDELCLRTIHVTDVDQTAEIFMLPPSQITAHKKPGEKHLNLYTLVPTGGKAILRTK